MQIWKFPLDSQTQILSFPRGAKPLACQVQHGIPCIWVLCDPTAHRVQRTVRIVGTGWEIGADPLGEYIGTYQLGGGALVFHVFIGEEN